MFLQSSCSPVRVDDLHSCRYMELCSRRQENNSQAPMPFGVRPWEEIAMEFVGELPISDGYNAILVVTDRFTKVQRYLPVKTTWTAEDVANAHHRCLETLCLPTQGNYRY